MQNMIRIGMVGFLILTLGCKKTPTTLEGQTLDKKEITSNIVVEQDIIDAFAQKHMGQILWHEILSKYPLYYQPELTLYLNEVGAHVSIPSLRKSVAYHFYILDSQEVFSLGLPGGDILVSRGLLQKIETESELAGVLGTEIVAVEKQYFLRLLQKDHPSESIANSLIQNKKKIAESYLFLRNNRFTDQQINEADRLGMTYAQHFGYIPEDFHQLLERLFVWQSTQKKLETGKYNYDILDHRRSMSQVIIRDLAKHQEKFPKTQDRYKKYKKFL
ncbi:MAG: hypothetical protein KDK51_10580 [Deltaproteobacteria bacterium]|nr:hypothetical protein [Deltaproteobacteria bacterium]